MLTIGRTYLKFTDGQVRLCADISLNGKGTTLWFGVDEAQGDYLCVERSDAFVLALLPTAMRGGYTIQSETPMSERLHYQLENYLIPTLCSAGDLYHPVKILAPLCSRPVVSRGGVATGFSGGVDSLHTVMTHGKDSAFPLTHLAVFNLGVFEGPAYQQVFQKSCQNAMGFAREMGLELIGLDSNLPQVLPERYLDVIPFRLMTGALALQGGLSCYLIASTYTLGRFGFDLRSAETFMYFAIQCCQTESLRIYNSGVQCSRIEKIRMIANWEPAHRWLHFCIYGIVGSKNCGKCKKCARDITTLYAQGELESFGDVLDLPAVRRTLPRQLGLVLACRDSALFDDAAGFLESSGKPIPAAARVYAQQFGRALNNLREEQT